MSMGCVAGGVFDSGVAAELGDKVIFPRRFVRGELGVRETGVDAFGNANILVTAATGAYPGTT